MPFFRYSGTDKSGSPVDGTVEAPTPDDAMLQLVRRGVNVSQLMKALSQPSSVSAPAQQVAALPEQRRVTFTTPTLAHAVPASHVTRRDVVRTKPASDKDRSFLFAQFSKQLKAGIGPAEALSDLRTRVPKFMSRSLEEASKAATNGQPISDTFERYPDLYPEHVAGMLRAGENGGFLEEATELLSDHAMNSHQFGRMFIWVRPMIVNAIVSLPLVVLLLKALVQAWKIVDAQGEEASAGSTAAALLHGVWLELLWPIGPLTLLLWAAAYFAYCWMASEKVRRHRHEVAFKWPVFKARTRHEGLAVFSWTMAKLAKAGVAPKKSWDLAANAVPNMAVRDRLLRIGNSLSGSERLSEAVFKEKLFPDEYAPILATAEHTGDLPGAFEQLSKVSQSEFDAAQTHAGLRSGRWASAGCMAIGGLLLILLMIGLYYWLMPAILKGFE